MIVIDLSHLTRWQGRMSGIERVEYNLVKYYVDTDSKFINWNESVGDFELWSLAKVKDLLSNIEKVQLEEKTVSNSDKKRLLHRVKGKISGSKNTTYKASKTDKLVVLDGLWDKQGYIDSLASVAKEIKVYHVVYDMIPVLYPGFVLEFLSGVFEKYMKQVLPLCEGILAISENSAKDTRKVLRDWGVRKIPKIESFKLGDDIMSSINSSDNNLVKEDYALIAGTIEVRKNHMVLLSVYGLAKEKNINLMPTYIVGRRGWLSEDFQYLVSKDKYLSDKIKVFDDASDDLLSQLYKNSQFVVCPSLYEGWGLPVREALAYGKVTLSSNTSSLPEAGGINADYFSPNSPDELLRLYIKYTNRSNKLKREKEIQNNFKVYTWEQSAKNFHQKLTGSN